MGYGLILRGKPKISHFHEGVMNCGLLDPKRRVLGWLRFNSADGEILVIHPDSAAKEKLVRDFRLGAQNVRAAVNGIFRCKHCKIVIPAGYLDTFAILVVDRLPLRFQQTLEDEIDHTLGPALRDHR